MDFELKGPNLAVISHPGGEQFDDELVAQAAVDQEHDLAQQHLIFGAPRQLRPRVSATRGRRCRARGPRA